MTAVELSAARGVSKIVGIRRGLACLIAAIALAACETAGERPLADPSFQARSLAQNVCSGYTCDGPGAQPNATYPYRLNTHCGVLGIRFDGRPFYVEAMDPSTVAIGLDNPEDVGTMTLLSPHTAVFRAAVGKQIRFVDAPPGVIGEPYPFRVLVLSGGNQLIDRGFAGRLWHAEGVLPGITGPPLGPKGQDAVTAVDGTMTLTGPDTAVFRSGAAEVRFAQVGPVGCD
jgi:hypothetical protein